MLNLYHFSKFIALSVFVFLLIAIQGHSLKGQTTVSLDRSGPISYNIQIYPNPINHIGFLHIDPAVFHDYDQVTFLLYNIIGKEVKRIDNIKKTNELVDVINELLEGKFSGVGGFGDQFQNAIDNRIRNKL